MSKLTFEDTTVNAPKNYHNILTQSFGEYMIPLKVSSVHGETVFDMDIPYEEYCKLHREELISKWKEYREKINLAVNRWLNEHKT